MLYDGFIADRRLEHGCEHNGQTTKRATKSPPTHASIPKARECHETKIPGAIF
jgi:hypothetical protein